MQRCTLCDHPVWPGQKLVTTNDGKAHRKCQRQAARESIEPNPADYLRVTPAAQLKGITREAMRQIIRNGYLPAYCELCYALFPLSVLQRSQPSKHRCPRATGQARVNVVLRREDVEKYEIGLAQQKSGRLGGLARAASRKEAP